MQLISFDEKIQNFMLITKLQSEIFFIENKNHKISQIIHTLTYYLDETPNHVLLTIDISNTDPIFSNLLAQIHYTV